MKERLIGAVVLAALAVWLIPWLLDGPDEPLGGDRAVLELPVPSGHIGEIRTEVIDLAPRRAAADAAVSGAAETSSARSAGAESAVSNPDRPAAAVPPASSPSTAPPSPAVEPESASAASAVAARDAAAAPRNDAEAAPAARVTERSTATPPQASPPTTAAPAASTPPRAEASAPAVTGDWAVQLGSFSDEDNARRLASRAATAGHEATISTFRSNGRAMYRVRVGPLPTRAAAETTASALAARGFDTQIVTAR